MQEKRSAKLYQYTACPFCWKVKAILDKLQIPFEEVEVEPMKKKELSFSKDYKKVPLFVDSDGTVVADSNEIMRYLDKRYATKSLFSDSKREKDLFDLSEKFAFALPPVIYKTLLGSWRAFAYISQVSSFPFWQKGFIRLFGSIVMFLVAKKKAKARGITDPDKHLHNLFVALHPLIATMPGNQPEAGDYAVWGILRSVQELPCFAAMQSHQEVLRWYNQVGQSLPEKK